MISRAMLGCSKISTDVQLNSRFGVHTSSTSQGSKVECLVTYQYQYTQHASTILATAWIQARPGSGASLLELKFVNSKRVSLEQVNHPTLPK